MAARPLILQTTMGRLKLWAKPGERKRRTRSTGAMLADKISLKQCLLLCAACETKMGRHWGNRHGYRLLHNMHTEGNCDGCQDATTGNLWHFVSGDYVQQWDAVQAVMSAAKAQRLQITDRRRVFAVS